MADSKVVRDYRIPWYGAAIFLSSAVVMVLEISAGRLIAPYVGVSLYTWTAIIGVVLAGLSLGNWLGGRWADQGGNERAVGITLMVAGLFSLFSLLVLTIVAPFLKASTLDLVSSSFLYALTMFLAPAVLLGVITPLLTTLALQLDVRSGHVVGRMHALAALGSIVGTFLTGYVLIQYIGTRNVIVATSALLFVLALPFFRNGSRWAPLSLALGATLLAVIVYARAGFANPCDRESNYFCLRVVDTSADAPFGTAKALILDHLIHGINHESEPGMMISPYVHLMDELVLRQFPEDRVAPIKFFFAGGGAYTQPRAVQALYPEAAITVAELDPAVTDMVAQSLYVQTEGMEIIHQDARAVLHHLSHRQFDVVIIDAFHDIAIPYHLLTREFVQLVRSRLAGDGLLATNVVDAFPDARLVKSLVNTLATEFRYVDVWVDTLPDRDTRLTYVIAASNSKQHPDMLQAQRGFDRTWYRINEPLRTTGTSPASLPAFTDDLVPVERLMAKLLFSKQGR